MAVGANQSVDLQWTAGVGGAYQATAYVVYRTKKVTTLTDTTEYYPIFTIPVSMLAAGYDGAAATKVHDRDPYHCRNEVCFDFSMIAGINKYLQFR